MSIAPALRVVAAVVLAGMAGAGMASGADAPAGYTFRNPLTTVDFPDPTVIKVGHDLYAFSTGDDANTRRAIKMVHTVDGDLTRWTSPVFVLDMPAWGNSGFWAPEVIQVGDRFIMYYSAKRPNDGRYAAKEAGRGRVPCLGVAISTGPLPTHFTEARFDRNHVGRPLTYDDAAADRGAKNGVCGGASIDSHFFRDTPGDKQPYLYWGSGHHLPVKRAQIAPDMISLVPGTYKEVLFGNPYDESRAYNTPQAVTEGNWIFYRNGYYYMFTSGWHCCDPAQDDTYAVSVWRSKLPAGDFQKYPGHGWQLFPYSDNAHTSDNNGKPGGGTGGGTIVFANAQWKSPGHNSMFQDGAGNDWILYHARTPESRARFLMMDKLKWVNFAKPGQPADEWPVIDKIPASTDEGRDTPSIAPQPGPARFKD